VWGGFARDEPLDEAEFASSPLFDREPAAWICPDGTKPVPGGWNRIHLIVGDSDAEPARHVMPTTTVDRENIAHHGLPVPDVVPLTETDPAEVPLRTDSNIYGVHELPVTWDR
jgi:hypothetical protein